MRVHHSPSPSRHRESRKKEKGAKSVLVSIIRDTRALETASHLADVLQRTFNTTHALYLLLEDPVSTPMWFWNERLRVCYVEVESNLIHKHNKASLTFWIRRCIQLGRHCTKWWIGKKISTGWNSWYYLTIKTTGPSVLKHLYTL